MAADAAKGVYEFRLPDIGEGVSEGEIVACHVSKGQAIREDEPMLEVMTDKATVTINSPRTGMVSDVRATIGEKIKVGTVVVVIATDDRPSLSPSTSTSTSTNTSMSAPASASSNKPSVKSPAASQASGTQHEAVASAVGDLRDNLPGVNFLSAKKPTPQTNSNGANGYYAEKPLATPATRKLARDLGVDLHHVRGTGADGRVTKDDVMQMHGAGSSTNTSASIAPTSTQTRAKAPAPSFSRPQSATADRKPFIGLRRKIAERMQWAHQTAAPVTFVEEFDAGNLMDMRERMRRAAERQSVKLTFLPFIVKATVMALRKFPALNSYLDEERNEWVFENRYDIGIATATDNGLLVPVLRGADHRSLIDMASEIDRLAVGARQGTLTTSELTGSTFTITSLGAQGGLFATPMLNMPEVGILGVHRLREKPVVRDGEIVAGHTMTLSLSFDHRLIDGHVGAAFTYEVIGYLEEPERMMLEMT